MNERFIILQEKYFDDMLTTEEKIEFDNFLKTNAELKTEFEEHKRIKEVLRKMRSMNSGFLFHQASAD